MSLIKAIDKASVHKICSGQVVLNLATAVKELVENSLDAEAKNIEIRLKDFGASLVEVSDDGIGVEEKNIEGLTLKHHTSKIRDCDDLSLLETFGFRGEALSSLCALCQLSIITKHKDAEIGYKLAYDHNGIITSKSPYTRLRGTTVSLVDLFSTLPVRYKEFQKHIKREYKKLLSVINAYCIISTGVRITCINQNSKGKRTNVVATTGSNKLLDNITSVYGRHEMLTLIPFVQAKPTLEVCEMFLLNFDKAIEMCDTYTISGYISACTKGRSSSDRQLFFVNNRPCDLSKMAKVVNDAFHVFDRHHYPFVILNMSMKQELADVNLTPDKRKVFLENEKLIFAIIRTSILAMYDGSTDGHQIGNSNNNRSSQQSTWMSKSNISQCQESSNEVERNVSNIQNHITNNSITCIKNSPNSNILKENKSPMQLTKAKLKSTNFLSQFQSQRSPILNYQTDNMKKKRTRPINDYIKSSKAIKLEESLIENKVLEIKTNEFGIVNGDEDLQAMEDVEENTCEEEVDGSEATEEKEMSYVLDNCNHDSKNIKIKSREINCSVQRIQERIKRIAEFKKIEEQNNLHQKFSTKIDPKKNDEAEKELTKHLSKDAFVKMKVIGQFNLGFIIAQLKQDIFIVDQHATDEKYNFEMLQKNSEVKGQRLISPQKLETSSEDLLVLEENMQIIEKNGFVIDIKDDHVTEQTSAFLVSVPGSIGNSYTFGASDIHEMIFMLNGMPGVMCRPSRIRQMFASKACRKSVMIGTALKKNEMLRLLHHMSELSQPWNCPHGRPTMRHLIDMKMIK